MIIFFTIFGCAVLAVVLSVSLIHLIDRFPVTALKQCGWVVLKPLGNFEGKVWTKAEHTSTLGMQLIVRGPPVRMKAHPGLWTMGLLIRLAVIWVALWIALLVVMILFTEQGGILGDLIVIGFTGILMYVVIRDGRPWPDKLGVEDTRLPHAWDSGKIIDNGGPQ